MHSFHDQFCILYFSSHIFFNFFDVKILVTQREIEILLRFSDTSTMENIPISLLLTKIAEPASITTTTKTG